VLDLRLHLVKVPLRTEKLVQEAKRWGIAVRDLDDGYVAHCLLRQLWQDMAPTPFVLRGRGPALDVWGYTRGDATALKAHARDFGDPQLLATLDDVSAIASKEMPRFNAGRRIGFLLRACPVVRLSKGRGEHRAGAEIDAFLAASLTAGADVAVSREEVYQSWLKERLGDGKRSGVEIERIAVAAFTRERLVRRTRAPQRETKRLERPDVRFEGDLIVRDGDRLLAQLAHGVGRHRAFGFGALIVVPPGTAYPRA
jgi:CRISPR system Cascade subunit CasE